MVARGSKDMKNIDHLLEHISVETQTEIDHSEEANVVNEALEIARDPQANDWLRFTSIQALALIGRAENTSLLECLLAIAREPGEKTYIRYYAYQSLKRLLGSTYGAV
jgi:hypothetical protein